MYKNNCSVLGLTKGSCKFTKSDFHLENPFIKTANFHKKSISFSISSIKKLLRELSTFNQLTN